MKKSVLLFILFMCTYQIYAQKTVGFELPMPDDKVYYSRYANIECLNSMENYSNLGQISYSRKTEIIVAQVPFRIQLDTLAQRIIDKESSQGKTLLLHIRNLYFSEGEDNEAFCHIRINLYEKDNTEYRFVAILDQNISANAKSIVEEAASVFTSFVADNLSKAPQEGTPYTLDEVRNIAAFEKADTPLYSTSVYEDGVYPDFHSFAEQQPDKYNMQAKLKNGELKEIKISNSETNKWEKVNPQNAYAVVYNGNAYIAKGKKFYQMYRNGDNLLFIGEESAGVIISPAGGVSVSSGHYGSTFGGGFGIAIGPKKKDKIVYMIDHLNGDFIFVEKSN